MGPNIDLIYIKLLATLLITRQVIGNIKESVLPYLSRQFKLAKMSYNLFGALEEEEKEADKKKDEVEQNDNHVEKQASQEGEEEAKGARPVSQAQLESSMEPVCAIAF